MILRACPYYTMFPLDFPLAWLRRAAPGQWVLDPFCGRGTTLYAARLLGLPASGADVSPVAAAIAEGMLGWARPEEILGLAARLLRLILLGRLHGPLRKGAPAYLSNQMPRTYAPKPEYAVRFWKARGLRPPEVDPLELLTRKVPELLRDLPPPVPGRVVCGDARTLDFRALGGPFDWVITSPPYYGMRTYVPDQWLRYWLVGGPPRVAYRYEGQIGRGPACAYVAALRSVWENVARACRPGARLVVRFGALPSRQSPEPMELLRTSLERTPWKIRWLRRAGSPEDGRRQARTFHAYSRSAVEEIDVLAMLAE